MRVLLLLTILSSLIFPEYSIADTYYSCSTDNEKLAEVRIYGYSGQFSFAGPYTSRRSVEIDDAFKAKARNVQKEVYPADADVLVDVTRYSKTFKLAWSLNGSVEIGSIEFDCLSFSGTSHIGYFDTGDETNKATPFIKAVINKEIQPLNKREQEDFLQARNQRRRSKCIVPRIEIRGPKSEVALSELLTTEPMVSLGDYTIEHVGEESTYIFHDERSIGEVIDLGVLDAFYDFVYDPSFPRETFAYFEADPCE